MDSAVLARENAHLKARLAEAEAALAEVQEANRRLEDILRTSQREKFGKRSEKLPPDQFNLPLEDAELAQGVLEAAQAKAEAALRGKDADMPRKPARNRGHLPPHLPRVERVIQPASTQCPCGCGEMARIGEDVSERLDVIPAQFRVLVTRRPKDACRRCSQAVAQAHAPEHVVPGGLPTELFIAVRPRARTDGTSMAHHRLQVRRPPAILPPGRDLQAAGDRSGSRHARQLTGRACFHLMPIINHMKAHLRGADRIFVDETQAPMLDPGRKATKSGYFWAVVSDDRGHGSAGPPVILFHSAPGRGQVHPLKFLALCRSRFLQCDAYPSDNALAEIARDNGPWRRVYCQTHVRRRFVKRFENGGSPIAALKPWLEAQLSRIPQKSQLAEDIRYTLAHWSGLIRFLEDGTLALDTNPVEHQIRPIALTRKKALFAGNEIGAENWPILASRVATCTLSGVNPVDQIDATLRAILDGHPQSGIEDLMPSRDKQTSTLAA